MTEHIQVPGRRLGRRPPSDKPTLKASSFLRAGALPQVPEAVDHLSGVSYGMYNNDKWGTCGPTSLANYVRMVTAKLTGTMREPSWADVKALYMLENPDFDENTGAGDNGVDMKTMLSDAIKHGFGATKVLGFASVDVSQPEEIQAAVAVFGGVLLGLDLEVAQQAQTDAGTWDYQASSEWGGHAVLEGAYEASEDEDCITWAQRVAMTPRFLTHQRQEAYVVILQDHLDDPEFMAGWDLTKFAQAYQDITGQPFPAVTPPKPPTPPSTDPAGDALAAATKDWAAKRHCGATRKVAQAIETWLKGTGRA